ncbi:MAG TPA: hypothetical protein VGC17_04130 [Lactovum miscens]|uniref:hypothetical protein n=1 Tax=Lactovum miscens TaxID=190387 RepID=UPI002ED7AEA3
MLRTREKCISAFSSIDQFWVIFPSQKLQETIGLSITIREAVKSGIHDQTYTHEFVKTKK